MRRLAHPPLCAPVPHQLTLPLDPPDVCPPPTPPAPVITLTTQQVWPTLSPTTQVLVRQTVLRILQEVVHGAPES
jgi:hypothetical protein